MITRTTKVIAFSIPPSIYEEVGILAKNQRKTKSELFREMIRIYQRFCSVQENVEDQWIQKIIKEAKIEAKNYNLKQEEKEYKESLDYGMKQARKLGIKSETELERYLNDQ